MKNILASIMLNVEASLVVGAFVGAKVGVLVDPVGAKIGVLVDPVGTKAGVLVDPVGAKIGVLVDPVGAKVGVLVDPVGAKIGVLVGPDGAKVGDISEAMGVPTTEGAFVATAALVGAATGDKVGVPMGEGLVKTLEQQEILNPVWKSEQVKLSFPLLAANSRSSHDVVFVLFSSCKTLAGSGSN